MLDLGIDLNVWPWVWLGVGVTFSLIELTILAGSFVLLPFAVSALAAALLGFYDVAIEIQWLVFVGGGALLWVLLYRYAKHFAGNSDLAPGVGAERLIGLDAIVTVAIDPEDTTRRGRVSAHGEVWGAVSQSREVLPFGTHVEIVEVNGTRVVVRSTDPANPSSAPPSSPPTPTSPSPTPPPAPPPATT